MNFRCFFSKASHEVFHLSPGLSSASPNLECVSCCNNLLVALYVYVRESVHHYISKSLALSKDKQLINVALTELFFNWKHFAMKEH